MSVWSGFPYERLPDATKSPVKWAIAGAVIGVIAGLLTGANPFLLGIGLLMTGAAVGIADNMLVLSRDDDEPKNLGRVRKGRGDDFGGHAEDRGIPADTVDFRTLIEARRSLSRENRGGFIG